MRPPSIYGLSSRPRHLPPFQALLCLSFKVPLARRTFITDSKNKKSEPLRILFCGSDLFSCASLQALYDEHIQNPWLIESIDVVTRPGKRVARGHKAIRHPPIRVLSTQLELPVHERDTLTGWDMPPFINIIIAVSFGLFVPPRLLHAAKYGGLNLHPSLLPDLRGPAPIHHALLRGDKFTGVTLQTLHDKVFDHGIVLAQTPMDDLLAIPESTHPQQLTNLVAPIATEMLVQGLRDGLYVPPLTDCSWQTQEEKHGALPRRKDIFSVPLREDIFPNTPLAYAPKIQGHDRQLIPTAELAAADWMTQFPVRQRVMGPLWFMVKEPNGGKKRIAVQYASLIRPLSPPVGDDPVIVEDEAGHRESIHIPDDFPVRLEIHSKAEDGTPFTTTVAASEPWLFGNDGVFIRPLSAQGAEGGDKPASGECLWLKSVQMEGEKAKLASVVFSRIETSRSHQR